MNYWPFNSLAVRDGEHDYIIMGFCEREVIKQQTVCCLECTISDTEVSLEPVSDPDTIEWLQGILYEYLAAHDKPLKFGVDFYARDIIDTLDAPILLDKLKQDGVYQVEYSHDNERWYVYGEARATGNVDPYLFWQLINVEKFVNERNTDAEKTVAEGRFPYPARYWRYREIIVQPKAS